VVALARPLRPCEQSLIRWRLALARCTPEPIAKTLNLGVWLDAMLADQLIRRNLDFTTTLAAHVDDFSSAEIIEGRIRAIDEAAAHHSPGVECGGSGGSLLMRHLVIRIRCRIALARNRDGCRSKRSAPGVGAAPHWRPSDRPGVSGSGMVSDMPPYDSTRECRGRAARASSLLAHRQIEGIMDPLQRAIPDPQIEVVVERALRQPGLSAPRPIGSRSTARRNARSALHARLLCVAGRHAWPAGSSVQPMPTRRRSDHSDISNRADRRRDDARASTCDTPCESGARQEPARAVQHRNSRKFVRLHYSHRQILVRRAPACAR
jgi:hypothetical protein